MKMIVLPGYSTKNKEWGSETAQKLGGELIEWEHWSDTKIKFNSQREAEKVLSKINQNKTNFIAKSLGTLVLMKLLNKTREVAGKIILCGIPINDMDENDLSFYKILSDINPSDIIIFQNSEDSHGSFVDVRRFVTQINPYLKIIEKPGSTHDYPYFDEFEKFIK